MSTSDLNQAAAGSAPAAGLLPGEYAPPVPVAQLAALANEFFRALPGSPPGASLPNLAPSAGSVPSPGLSGLNVAGPSAAAIVPPPPVPVALPSLTSAVGIAPVVAEFGLPLPGVPSLPTGDKLPSEAEAFRLGGEASSPVSSGVVAPPASTVPGFPGAQVLSANTLQTPGPAPAAASAPLAASVFQLIPVEGTVTAPDAQQAAPPALPLPGIGLPDTGTSWSGVPLTGLGTSPFSVPLPDAFPGFDASLYQPRNKDFDAALPGLTGLDTYPNEEQALLLTRSAAEPYFLQDAAVLAQPVGAVPAAQAVYAPDLVGVPVGDLGLKRNQFDIASVRHDFPILNEQVNGKPLVWLDNAATTQKPQSVIDRISWFYEHENSNVHRGAHELAARSTDAYEDARQKVARFLNAPSAKEIVWVRGATEGINLIAKGWGKRHIGRGDEIVLSTIEHHANIVPWQQLAAETGAVLRVIPVDDDGQVLLDEYEKLLSPRTRLVAVAQVSNALGTILPTYAIVAAAHRYGARVLVDGAQSVSHMRTDVQDLDCDFFVFSGHKVYGPTGIGVVYGKPDAWAETPPWQGGGNMIVDVTFEKTIYHAPPARFEAGTGSIADAVGLGAAIDYIEAIGMENIGRHEHELFIYATQQLKTIPGLRLIGTAKEKAAVLSFLLDGFETEEVGSALNREGIAVRSGHHCAQPSLRRFGVESTVRPSLGLYNSYEDIDKLIAALRRLKSIGA